ncbi:hypothetical protein R0V13_04545 [Facklamia hominis]|uniref:hypothetical protein n=1 Tax=Facklamia hominis TaxID=178214 RepID=UPI0029D41D43|nr:hypothetical protein [Facklamia hominis]WPJ91627.1 hypothetical protein R0V13_04545 [Facklamia hominis]
MQKFQQLQELYYRGALKKGSPEWREYFALKYGIEGEATMSISSVICQKISN